MKIVFVLWSTLDHFKDLVTADKVLTDRREEDAHSIRSILALVDIFIIPVNASGQHRTSKVILTP